MVLSGALGITAALYAESALNPNAVNKSSGAYGISQWLGGRKRSLFKKYGPHPSLDQQLEFLWGELSGGDAGGAAVLAQRGTGTASAMVNKFLRPAKGHETNRDLAVSSRFISSHMKGGAVHIRSACQAGDGVKAVLELGSQQHQVLDACPDAGDDGVSV